MTASAPSKTAVATSDTSARVGTGAVIMLSSICVATTTGLPIRRPRRVMRFCTPGTASSGISTPRSPRATITPSASSMIASSCCSACGFSILAMMPARFLTVLRASAMSSGRWMKERATQSTSAASAASRSRRSFSVKAPERISVSGRLTPLRSESFLPCTTSVTARRRSDLDHLQPHAAVVQEDRVAGLERCEDLGMRKLHALAGCRAAGRCRARRSGPSSARRSHPRRPRSGASAPAGRRRCQAAGRISSRRSGWRPRAPASSRARCGSY